MTMKAKRQALLFAAILFGGVSMSYAMETAGSKPDASASAGKALAKRQAALYGDPIGQAQASRIVDLKPGTRYVNVSSGETVAFRSDEKISAWAFAQMVRDTSVDLNLLLPDLPRSADVRIYIERSDLVTGG
ncbi:MAG: CzcE family metal-binding protein [Cupriavidus sp.]|nr:CzcE family metal-binding protein [Cupriavidus sp.]MCA3774946.1 CzcE family metal-binding protein [Cutibacterium sp.]QWE98363.1 CzcE family metal-binding protein [Cupriavidus sp. EM10]MCA3193972.1 CzcE family metal-binding protein [Cupriavidus sp.]MCA3198401.1 CzcE family metal-binding protein [Cupriavidus sp.]